MPGRVRIFLATSLDGFIAGPNDEIDWLDGTKQTEDIGGSLVELQYRPRA
jgi:hypothetical protein